MSDEVRAVPPAIWTMKIAAAAAEQLSTGPGEFLVQVRSIDNAG